VFLVLPGGAVALDRPSLLALHEQRREDDAPQALDRLAVVVEDRQGLFLGADRHDQSAPVGELVEQGLRRANGRCFHENSIERGVLTLTLPKSDADGGKRVPIS